MPAMIVAYLSWISRPHCVPDQLDQDDNRIP